MTATEHAFLADVFGCPPWIIEAWRREYNDERPKNALGGLTPAAYARQLTNRTDGESNRRTLNESATEDGGRQVIVFSPT
jgi:hypothetical protein